MATETGQNEATPEATSHGLAPNGDTPQKDTTMLDAPIDQAAVCSPTCPTLSIEPLLTSSHQSPLPTVQAPSPAPARMGTPAHGSRAASAHPDPGLTIPSEAAPHGDSTRRYLNTKVTGVLLEGMKQIAKDKYGNL